MIEKIEKFMNKLTEMDWGWWPVVSWRPAKDENIDNSLLFKMMFVFGSPIGVILLVYFYQPGMPIIGNLVLFTLIGWVFFFIFYKFTFAYFWNRRARRLRRD